MFRGVARANAKDERLFALAEVRDLTPVQDERGRVVALPELERVLVSVLEAIRGFQARRPLHRRLMWNRVAPARVAGHRAAALTRSARSSSAWRPGRPGWGSSWSSYRDGFAIEDGFVRYGSLRFFVPAGHDVAVEVEDAATEPLRPLDEGTRRMSAARRRGTLHPAEIVKLLAPGGRGQIHTAGPARRGVRRARAERRWPARAGRPSAGDEPDRHRRRHGAELHRPLPGGNAARDPPRRPDPRAWIAGRARVPANRRGDRPRRGARRPAGVVRALGRSEDRDGLGDRDDGLDCRRAASDRAVHAGRRRAQRGRRAGSTSGLSPTATPRRRC